EAVERARSIVSRAVTAGDRIAELCGRILELTHRVQMKPTDATARLDALIAKALPVFEEAGDGLALRLGYRAIGEDANIRAEVDQLAGASEQAPPAPRAPGETA